MTKARDLANGGFGLVLVKPSSVVGGTDNGKGTVSFSAASTVSLNGVFNSTYTNYKIKMDSLYGSSSGNNILFRLRKSGSDNSDSNSYIRRGFVSSDSALSNQVETGTNFFLTQINSGSTAPAFVEFELYLPFASNQTGLNSLNFRANDNVAMTTIGRHTTVDTFDGCSFIASAGTITGTVSVYGYNK